SSELFFSNAFSETCANHAYERRTGARGSGVLEHRSARLQGRIAGGYALLPRSIPASNPEQGLPREQNQFRRKRQLHLDGGGGARALCGSHDVGNREPGWMVG